ncbi:hypothetical protein M8523_22805 [Hyphomicrobiales bacterium BP6-180914]|uniref:RAG2 PHD domain containing protein n=2 Tax=Lichenifustis flavocetrariae TaxID=2949735 RepID=A0AA42CKR6_9HYPH|nr:hypothetical protein [Lichenifustis flavocetrariae]MCW6510849.1 hypothetical protein [Lichenifustis flavocetrariae]
MQPVAYTSAEATQAKVESHFIIGQDPSGHWLAIETHRLGGGLFKSRADAVHFVEFETGRRPGAVEFSPTPVRLSF